VPNNKLAKTEREELGGLDAAGLRTHLDTAKRKLWTDSFAHGKRQLEKTADLGKTRKRIARIETYLRKLAPKETN
jgi:ribosomal protein L29